MKITAEERIEILNRLSEDDKDVFLMWESRGWMQKDIYTHWYKQVYLFTDHWKREVAESAIRADGHCMICGQRNLPMNNHHNIYRLWREKPSDTIYLCHICHPHNHGIFQANLIRDFEEDLIRDELREETVEEAISLIDEVEQIVSIGYNRKLHDWEKCFWQYNHSVQMFVNMIYDRISDFVDPIPIMTAKQSDVEINLERHEKEASIEFPNWNKLTQAQQEVKSENPDWEPFSKTQQLKMKIIQEFCQRKYTNS
jgi:hypothetical protein